MTTTTLDRPPRKIDPLCGGDRRRRRPTGNIRPRPSSSRSRREELDIVKVSGEADMGAARRVTSRQVWSEVGKASFAIIGHVTPTGEPRSSGVVYAAARHRLYVAIAPDGWKARQIADGQEVAVTVPVRRGGVLSLVLPIPPATVSFHARTIVHPAGPLNLTSASKKLKSLVPKERRAATVLELVPEGRFLTYGIGVSLKAMMDPVAARAHVPIAEAMISILSPATLGLTTAGW